METYIDFREFEPRAQHALFFSLFEGLKEDGSFDFIDDHDPLPLHQQLAAMNLANLCWEYESRGPDIWRIKISKKIEDQSRKEGCRGLDGSHDKRGN